MNPPTPSQLGLCRQFSWVGGFLDSRIHGQSGDHLVFCVLRLLRRGPNMWFPCGEKLGSTGLNRTVRGGLRDTCPWKQH